MMTCTACGTVYEPPSLGPPYCPNNNCPLHSATSAAASSPLEAAHAAIREAEAWTAAIAGAERQLAEVKDRAKAAQAKARQLLAAARDAENQRASEVAELAKSYGVK